MSPERCDDEVLRLIAWIAERALRLPPEEVEELREMVASVERRQERAHERDESRRAVGAALIAEACLRVAQLPIVALTGASNG